MSDPLPFSFKPDWSQPITERLSWLTTIMQSRSGAEQRYAVRLSPRRQFDIPLLLSGQDRSYFDVILGRNGGGTWNVPIPHEEIAIGLIGAGQDTLYFDTAYREIAVGTKLLLRQDWDTSEIVTVTAVADTNVTITPTVLSYTAASATPTFVGVISEAVTASRKTARTYVPIVRFTSLEPALFSAFTPDNLSLYDPFGGYLVNPPGSGMPSSPLWLYRPNEINDLDYTYERMFSTVDSDASLPFYIDKAQRQFVSQKYEFFATGLKERWDFRMLLYVMRGRLTPVWIPTFNDDLSPGYGYPDPLGLGSATIPGREYFIRIKWDGTPELEATDGPPFGVAIHSTSDYLGVPPETYTDDAYAHYYFVEPKRFDVDDIEIQHYGTLEGVATCSVIFKSTPHLRHISAYTQPALTDPAYHTTGGDVTPTNDIATDNATVADLVATQTVSTGVGP